MRLKLNFGEKERQREVYWSKPIKDFPNLVIYNGKKYEFSFYAKDPSSYDDWDCLFSEVPRYDPNFWSEKYVDMEDMLGYSYRGKVCECGAEHTSFPWDHMKFCPKWTK